MIACSMQRVDEPDDRALVDLVDAFDDRFGWCSTRSRSWPRRAWSRRSDTRYTRSMAATRSSSTAMAAMIGWRVTICRSSSAKRSVGFAIAITSWPFQRSIASARSGARPPREAASRGRGRAASPGDRRTGRPCGRRARGRARSATARRCSTRISPTRRPVVRCTSSAASSCSFVISPRSIIVVPMRPNWADRFVRRSHRSASSAAVGVTAGCSSTAAPLERGRSPRRRRPRPARRGRRRGALVVGRVRVGRARGCRFDWCVAERGRRRDGLEWNCRSDGRRFGLDRRSFRRSTGVVTDPEWAIAASSDAGPGSSRAPSSCDGRDGRSRSRRSSASARGRPRRDSPAYSSCVPPKSSCAPVREVSTASIDGGEARLAAGGAAASDASSGSRVSPSEAAQSRATWASTSSAVVPATGGSSAAGGPAPARPARVRGSDAAGSRASGSGTAGSRSVGAGAGGSKATGAGAGGSKARGARGPGRRRPGARGRGAGATATGTGAAGSTTGSGPAGAPAN